MEFLILIMKHDIVFLKNFHTFHSNDVTANFSLQDTTVDFYNNALQGIIIKTHNEFFFLNM